MLEVLIKNLEQNGVVGVVLAIMLWFNYKLVSKLFRVIETNTEVMTNANKNQESMIEVVKKNTDIISESQKWEQSHREQSERTHNEVHLISTKLDDLEQVIDAALKRM